MAREDTLSTTWVRSWKSWASEVPTTLQKRTKKGERG
jgi:hypothetical protein